MISKQLTFAFEKDAELDPNIIRRGDPRWDGAIEELLHSPGFGLDIETYGRNKSEGLSSFDGRIRLIQVGLLSRKIIVIDFGGWAVPEAEAFEKEKDFLDILRKLLPNPKVVKIGQNLLFEQMWFKNKFDIDIRNIRDTILMSRLYWAGVMFFTSTGGLEKFGHNLGALATRFGLDASKELQRSDWGWDLTNAQLNYAAHDAVVVLDIIEKFKPMLKEAGLWEHALRECQASAAFCMMQYYGMPVNLKRLEEIIKKYEEAREESIKEFKKEFPGVDYASNDKVAKAAYEKNGLVLESTDKDHLAEISEPWAKSLLLWRALGISIRYLTHSVKRTGIKELTRAGFVRSNYLQLGPKGHGRTTSGRPNLQNAPNPSEEMKNLGLPSIREVFEAPKGYKMIVADLSQAHARIATEISQDSNLLKVYKEGADIHAITASKLAELRGLEWSDKEIKKWKKDSTHENHIQASTLRQIAKPVFYGSLNGQGGYTLMRTALVDGVEMNLEEAKEAIQAWREAYPALYQFQLEVNNKGNSFHTEMGGKEYGEVRGASGRRLYLEKWPGKWGPPKIKFTDAIAFVWMSAEADCMKEALARLVPIIDSHPEWDLKLGNLGHDEIDLIVKEEYAEEVSRLVFDVMNESMQKWVKTIPVSEVYSTGVCNNWAEGK